MTTHAIRRTYAAAFPDRPFTTVLWDGSTIPSTSGDGPTFTLRSPEALRHLLRSPGQLGVGRAYVAGVLEVDDLDKTLSLITHYRPPAPSLRDRLRLAVAAALTVGPGPAPVPSTELVLRGEQHTPERDAEAVRYHYDVPTEFFKLFLDETMTYSCAVFSHGAETLEAAQEAKHELVCMKLGLREGQRVLDVGCGWGAFAIHAATRHGVHVTGITLSEPQAQEARRRAQAAGVADRVDIRVADYRDSTIGETYDAIASVGMVEHVGEQQIDEYAEILASRLERGGMLLNHGIARLTPGPGTAGPFNDRYVFPDGDPLPLSRTQLALEKAGFETLHVEGFRSDYIRTLREWATRLDEHLDEGLRLAGPERLRVWRLYLRAAGHGFVIENTSIYQTRLIRR